MIPLRDSLPSRSVPYVTIALILINLLVFLYQGYLGTQPSRTIDATEWLARGFNPPPAFDRSAYGQHQRAGKDPAEYPVSGDDYFIVQYGLIAAELRDGTDLPPTIPIPLWATLLTSIFLHGGFLHLAGNMLYLWIFGDNVEDAMGHGRFLLFYLLCGVLAAASQIAVNPNAWIPMIGASGAIAGVLAAYFMLFPQSRVLTLIPIFFFLRLTTIPAVFFLGFWFLLQVIQGVGDVAGAGGTAWFAHIGGFIAGIILVFFFRKPGVPLRLLQQLRNRRR